RHEVVATRPAERLAAHRGGVAVGALDRVLDRADGASRFDASAALRVVVCHHFLLTRPASAAGGRPPGRRSGPTRAAGRRVGSPTTPWPRSACPPGRHWS